VANVIAHAFAGRPAPHRLDLRLAIAPASVVVEIVDNGRPFDPTAAPAPDLSTPLECREPGGLGIHLMRALMDRLDYRRDDDANVLRLEMTRR
jgi:anti-sigma regulatory factor (Ser/Thr protein kinase)